MICLSGNRAIDEPMTIRAAGTVMAPTMVTGRATTSGIRTPTATMSAARKAASMAGEKSTLGLRRLMLYSPLTSITPAVKMKNVLGMLSRAA